MSNVFIYTFVILFGLALSSFQNVLISRIPIGKTLWGRSRCASCDALISPINNIPIFSYIYLRGKCSKCGVSFSSRYFVVEILTPFLFMVGICIIPEKIHQAIWITLIFFGVPLAFIDLKFHRLPNSLNLSFFLFLVALIFLYSVKIKNFSDLKNAIIQSICLFVFYLLIRVLSRGGMGMGDAKLALSLGLISGYLGKYLIYISNYVSFVLGALFAIIFIYLKKGNRKTSIPFGPFMLVGLAFSILYINL